MKGREKKKTMKHRLSVGMKEILSQNDSIYCSTHSLRPASISRRFRKTSWVANQHHSPSAGCPDIETSMKRRASSSPTFVLPPDFTPYQKLTCCSCLVEVCGCVSSERRKKVEIRTLSLFSDFGAHRSHNMPLYCIPCNTERGAAGSPPLPRRCDFLLFPVSYLISLF